MTLLLRSRGVNAASQVARPDVTEHLLEIATDRQIPVFLIGGRSEIEDALVKQLATRFPRLILAGVYSPRFRPWTQAEEHADAEKIRASEARLCLAARSRNC